MSNRVEQFIEHESTNEKLQYNDSYYHDDYHDVYSDIYSDTYVDERYDDAPGGMDY